MEGVVTSVNTGKQTAARQTHQFAFMLEQKAPLACCCRDESELWLIRPNQEANMVSA